MTLPSIPKHTRRGGAAALTVGALFATSIAAALPASAADPSVGGDFASSFEAADPQPTWVNTVETDPSGSPLSSGITGPLPTGYPGSVNGSIAAVTASGENPTNEVKESASDGNANTKWLTFATPSVASPVWLQYRLSSPAVVVKYAMTSADDAPERDPRNWQLQGSSDGSAWTTLDTRTGETWTGRRQQREFTFTNAQAYSHYRLNIVANGGTNIVQLADLQLSTGIQTPPPPNMLTAPGSGPAVGYNIKPRVGFTGLQALQYGGVQATDGRGFAYNKVFDVDVPVGDSTQLSYKIFPELTGGDLRYVSTYASVDLAFTDGTYLHDLGAVDQTLTKLDPQSQGKSETLYPDQWNMKYSTIGRVAAGKTIDRILVAWDNPTGAAGFGGWIDDISIAGQPAVNTSTRPTDWVKTTRGSNSSSSYSRGSNYPATAVPHGFNFWTPVTDAGSTGTIYTYASRNNAENLPTLQAFSASHQPSIWMGDRQTFQVMPSGAAGVPNANRDARALAFKHENEIDRAHYYGVTFENGLKTEIAPTDHAAMFRFTFTGDSSNLIFDNVDNRGGLTIDAANNAVSGYSDVRSGGSTGATRMYVYATFDAPVTGSGKLSGGGGSDVTGYVKFDTAANKVVNMRIATSLLSVEQAKKNLALEIAPADTFDSVKDRAQAAWDETLGVIEVEGANDDQLTTLYSNLYRLSLWPNSGHENVGTAEAPVYKHAVQSTNSGDIPAGTTATQTGAPIADGKVYLNNGFWDTYRTSWPAYTLLYPGKTGELVDGFVQQYKDGGWIGRWSSPGYANLMTGTSSDVAFADAYVKGIEDFDIEAAYDAALRNASTSPPNANIGRKGNNTSLFLGYTPNSTHESVSWALEDWINDYGIAQMSKKLYDTTDATDPRHQEYLENYEYYLSRTTQYVNMFNPATGFFAGRRASGEFATPAEQFDPRNWWGDYTETNAWNFAFHAVQDGQGLANLFGGRDALGEKLDTFFSIPERGAGNIHEMLEARDVRMGQWGLSNQVSHHVPYMYNYAGQPSKTAAAVREGLAHAFTGSQIGQGYIGDEDNGEMSAWQIFSSLGFYPLQMGSTSYAIGSPLYTKATIRLENGKSLVLSAPDNSPTNVYVRGVRVNGVPQSETSFTHDQLANGGTIEFDMGATPSDWGTGADDVPASITQGDDLPDPMMDITGPGKGTATTGAGSAASALFDNNSNTEAPLGATPWVQYSLSGAKPRAAFYTLTSSNTEGTDPTGWVVKGSNDGVNWTTVDTRAEQDFMFRRYTRAFKIANPGIYGMYRVEPTGSSGAVAPALSEVEFLADTPEVSEVSALLGSAVTSGAVQPSAARDLEPILAAAATAESAHDKAAVLSRLGALVTQLNTLPSAKVTPQAKESLLLLTSQWLANPYGLDLLRERVGSYAASKDIATSTARDLQASLTAAQAARDAGDRARLLQVLRTMRTQVTSVSTSKVSLAARNALLPLIDDLIAATEPVGNLRPYFNGTGIGDDGAANANLAEGYYISRQALAAAGVAQGTSLAVPGTDVRFTLPALQGGAPDNVSATGQVLDGSILPASATKLSLVATSVLGDSNTELKVTYTDGSEQVVPVQVGDWTLGGSATATPRFGNIGIAKTAYRNNGSDTQLAGTPWLFATAPVSLAAGKQVQSITLPNTPNLRIFALAWDAPAAP